MNKIYLLVTKEKIIGSCTGCYYDYGDNKACNDNLSSICYEEEIIFKRVYPREDEKI